MESKDPFINWMAAPSSPKISESHPHKERSDVEQPLIKAICGEIQSPEREIGIFCDERWCKCRWLFLGNQAMGRGRYMMLQILADCHRWRDYVKRNFGYWAFCRYRPGGQIDQPKTKYGYNYEIWEGARLYDRAYFVRNLYSESGLRSGYFTNS